MNEQTRRWFDVPVVKDALWLLLGSGLDEQGKEMWLACRIDDGLDVVTIFGQALDLIYA